jgi:endoglucanase
VGFLSTRGFVATSMILACALLGSGAPATATSTHRSRHHAHKRAVRRGRVCHVARSRKAAKSAKAHGRRHKQTRNARRCRASSVKHHRKLAAVPARKLLPPAPVVPAPVVPASSDPFANQKFFVEPGNEASVTEAKWAGEGRSAEAAEIQKIAGQPMAKWFGDWSYGHGGTAADVNWWVTAATSAGSLPVIVAYDIPQRDCGSYSSGGAPSNEAYEQFINAMAQGIAGRKTVVILEPDALAELTCLSAEGQASYYTLLSYAVKHLSESPAVSVYLDAGNSTWQPAATMASRLLKADVAGARGFSLNVSNFNTTAAETTYGQAISADLATGSHFIIDTSRNGQGPTSGGEWCNPPGRGLGTPPTSQTANPLIDAYFWIKRPGESDGTCNGGPSAGEWWPEYALTLAQHSAG